MSRKYSQFKPVQTLSSQRQVRPFAKHFRPRPGTYCDESRSFSHSRVPRGTRKDRRRRKIKREQEAMSPVINCVKNHRRAADETIQERPSKKAKLQQDNILEELPKSHSTPVITKIGISDSIKTTDRKFIATDDEKYERHCKVASYLSRLNRHRNHSRKIKSSWVGMPSSAQKGIYNPAVLCYRNSLLQALLHTPKVVNWLRSYHRSKICVRDGILCVACHLLAVFNSYWGSTSKELLQATNELDRVFVSTGWQDGRTGRQEDPEEQLVWLAKVLSQQLPTTQFDAFEAISRFILNSSTSCSSCGYVSSNKGEVEGTISIDLQPKIKNGTIAEYIKPYFSHRVEGFKCDKCSSKSPKQRTREICHQPETLVIQLKRFGWDGRKDSTPIKLSAVLSLNVYRSDLNNSSCDYELSAIICHSGGMNSGHYVCRARGPDERWMKFDDLHVTGMTPEQAMHPGSRNGWTPYLLFYQRRVEPSVKR